MHTKLAAITIGLIVAAGSSWAKTGETEQDIINRYLKKTESKHTRRITWASATFRFDRINRDNDYNKFANYSSNHFSSTDIPWLGDAKSFGVDLGMFVGRKMAWSLGGEYWLKLGTNQSGPLPYTPPSGSPTIVENLVSEVKVWGVSTSVQYYLLNPPNKETLLSLPAVRISGMAGFYQVSWEVWDNYENLNLSTSYPEAINTTFKGSAPAFALMIGADYPLHFGNLALGVDVGMLYLNFTNVAWYNPTDQEIVATYAGTTDSRVDLNMTGIRGKIELKRFFRL
ncbi:MAG TPA: hypothetical protein VN285_02300 [Candidatus Deferrimicrobium sp.]|nr:hypothetical protein [Candidatus Deferrimicrobium sp.]